MIAVRTTAPTTAIGVATLTTEKLLPGLWNGAGGLTVAELATAVNVVTIWDADDSTAVPLLGKA